MSKGRFLLSQYGFEPALFRFLKTAVKRQGQALVELALVVPILILFLVGAAEFGRLIYAGIEVTNAARAGVQYGSQTGTTALDTTGIQTAATNDSPNITGLTVTPTRSCICGDGSASTCASSDCAGSHLIEYVQVNTSATIDPLIHYPGLPKTYTLNGKAVMRVLQP